MLAVGACPLERGGEIEVDVDVVRVGVVEVGEDAIVGGDLREGAGAAGPEVGEVGSGGVEVVVGVVEGVAVGLETFGSEDGVVEDALHGVAVAGVAGDAEEIAGELEVGVAAAGGFEAFVGFGKAGVEVAAFGGAEAFVGAPASGGEALRGDDHVEGVACGAEVLLAAGGEVCLHGGAEGVAEAVGVMAGEDVFVFGEWVEPGLVEEIAGGHLLVAVACASLGGEEEIFGQGVGLVPAVVVGGVVADGCAPLALGLVAVECVGRKMRLGCVGGAIEEGECLREFDELMGVDEADDYFVVDVGGEAEVGVEASGDGGFVEREELLDFGARAWVMIDGVASGEGGDPLAEGMGGSEAVASTGLAVEGDFVVPAAEIGAGGGEAGADAPGFEEAVFVEGEQDGLSLLELGLGEAGGEVDLAVRELFERSGFGFGGEELWAAVERSGGGAG